MGFIYALMYGFLHHSGHLINERYVHDAKKCTKLQNVIKSMVFDAKTLHKLQNQCKKLQY